MERWTDKVAVVTGASAGIGAAIVEELVKAGMQVVGLARRVDKMEELAAKLSHHPGKLHPYKTDLTQTPEILSAIEWTTSTLGPIHVLINNAGFLATGGCFAGDDAVWKSQIDSMLLAPCLLIKEVVKDMMANGVDGHIVNVNSVYGHVVNCVYNPDMGLYPAIKHGITALTETVRQELVIKGSKIKISSVSPGMTLSELFEQYPEEAVAAIPLLKCEDISNAVIYILSTPPHVQVHELIIKPIGERA